MPDGVGGLVFGGGGQIVQAGDVGLTDVAGPKVEVFVAFVEGAMVEVAGLFVEGQTGKAVAGGIVVEEEVLAAVAIHNGQLTFEKAGAVEDQQI